MVSLRERRLPRWIGVLSLALFVLPTVVMSITSVPGLPFVSIPWLLIVSLGMAARKEHAAR